MIFYVLTYIFTVNYVLWPEVATERYDFLDIIEAYLMCMRSQKEVISFCWGNCSFNDFR